MNAEWLQLVAVYSAVILWQVLLLTALFSMLYQRRSSTSMIAWLLAMLLIPYVGVALFYLIGWRKRMKKGKAHFTLEPVCEIPEEHAVPLDTLLRNNDIAGATAGNSVDVVADGVTAYRTVMRCIEEARESIDICIYILENDATGRSVLETLGKKAREGVRVRMLIDSLGSWELYFTPFALRALKQSGAEVAFFMPVFRMPFRSYINLRNHRKLMIFDGCKAISGSMNLSNAYMGADGDADRWTDLLFLIRGPAVNHYRRIFNEDWSYTLRSESKSADGHCDATGDTVLQVVPSGPDVAGDALYEGLLSAVYAAKERIWIVTPYFVPDENLQRALIVAIHRNVDVRLITPYTVNHPIVELSRSSYMRELRENGAQVILTEGRLLHAKVILFDRDTAMFGSVNFDNRSFFLNYEVATFTYSEHVVTALQQWTETLLRGATRRLKPTDGIRRIFENLMRVFAPQL